MLKQIRQTLGLSQETVAIYLGISRSQLAMVEAKRREINSPAYYKLLSLCAPLISNDPSEKSHSLTDTKKKKDKQLQKSIERTIKEKAFLLAAARRKLSKLQTQQQLSGNMLNKLHSLPSKINREDQPLIHTVTSQAQKLYEASSAEHLLQLQMKIAGLEAELKFLREKQSVYNS